MDSQRQEHAYALGAYLRNRTNRSQDDIEKFSNKILSGEHDDFMFAASTALRERSRAILADLADDRGAGGPARPEIDTLLLMEDENDREVSAGFRRGEQRSAQNLETVRVRLDRLATEQTSFVAVSEPFPPCRADFRQLRSIQLSELAVESRHPRTYLLVQRTSPFISGKSMHSCAVSDESGEAELVELYHVDPGIEQLIPTNATFAIKEPHLTIDRGGHQVLRVEHPDNIVYPRFLTCANARLNSRTAVEWKHEGNMYFAQKQYFAAREAYQAALSRPTEGSLKSAILRNLAQVELNLGLFESAKRSALDALSGDEASNTVTDGKAYYRAGGACYFLRRYDEAHECFQKLLRLSPEDEDGQREAKRVQKRLLEQGTGQYDFDRLIGRLSPLHSRIDVADFKLPTVIGESIGRGKGLFATHDLDIGELVLCEKAFSVRFGWERDGEGGRAYDSRAKKLDAFATTLWTDTVQKAIRNPLYSAKITSLCGGQSQEDNLDRTAPVDAFHIRKILAQNAFAVPTPSKSQTSEPFGFMKSLQSDAAIVNRQDNVALFAHASLINHSCIPNITRIFLGDCMILRATRPIRKGEELLQAYTHELDIRQRQAQLQQNWNFQCDCALCVAGSQESNEVRRRRGALFAEAEKLSQEIIVNLPVSAEWTKGVRRAETLDAALKATYDASLYLNLPRRAMVHIQTALAQVYLQRQDCVKAKTIVIQACDCLGWTLEMPARGTTAQLVPRAGVSSTLDEHVVSLLVVAGKALVALKQRKMAQSLEALSKKMYMALNGSMCGYDALPGFYCGLVAAPSPTVGEGVV